jgi:hypothetical protein
MSVNITNFKKLNLTIKLVSDDRNPGFTSWFEEYPNIVSEGETEEKAIQHLLLAFHDIIENEIIAKNIVLDFEKIL